MSTTVDQDIRDEVLDVGRSFIVQAPAGSGKTSLLVQRVLALLAVADRPEEVLAITFTRKAAAEMRERILAALINTRLEEPTEDFHRRTWQLARNVLARDQALGWNILAYPLRLSIQTIDSLSASLVRQMPWSSRTGDASRVTTTPEKHYAAAAQATLEHLSERSSPWHGYVITLLAQQDSDSGRVAGLLAGMLGKRDQWIRHVVREDLDGARERLEAAWEDVIRHGLARVVDSVPAGCDQVVADLAAAAAQNLAGTGNSPLLACSGLTGLPGTGPTDLAAWQGIRELLLVKGEAALRKRVDKRQGMPAKSEEKSRLEGLLERLHGETEWILNLHLVVGLPAARYEHNQWQGLLALVQVLKLAVAELQLQFRDAGEVDFTEVSIRAGRALGELANPSALALRLDYRLRHILIDEFQDTSHAQGDLLEHLVTGWEPGDGRTLFIVGDPMQSIYRFREADVGLFLRVRDHGVGMVRPEYRALECNFRSSISLVDWYNSVFTQVFPGTDDMYRGAVSYSRAVAASLQSGPSGVELYSLSSLGEEAKAVAAIVAKTIEEYEVAEASGTPGGTRKQIAILVRGKAHLSLILPALHARGIQSQAVELEPLANRQVVLDILSLVQAISRLDHRPAWLAILRAPWCGLTLANLKTIVGTDYETPIWFRVMDEDKCAALFADDDDREEVLGRLARMRNVLAETMQNRHRYSITEIVEWTWRQLGGPDCLAGAAESEARSCFSLLAAAERGGSLEGLEDVEELLADLYAAPVNPEARVQLMTIHKAKGLEFDTVILPGLHRQPGSDDRSALMWAEVTGDASTGGQLEGELLIAPMPETGSDATAQYEFLRELERARTGHEQARLLYVACTRAERKLHLLGVLQQNSDGEMSIPHSQSLLRRLWPAIGEEISQQFESAHPGRSGGESVEVPQPKATLSRLPAGYVVPDATPLIWEASVHPVPGGDRPEFIWAGDTARLVGVWVHELFSSSNTESMKVQVDDNFRLYCRIQLAVLGVEEHELDEAVARACLAISNVQDDPRVEWIFSASQSASRAELDISHLVGGHIERVRIDRTFIDAEDVRWIIDFKTGLHQGTDVEEFLDEELQRYRGQLEGYARVLSTMEDRAIRLGLYFPMHCGWREWEYLPEVHPQ